MKDDHLRIVVLFVQGTKQLQTSTKVIEVVVVIVVVAVATGQQKSQLLSIQQSRLQHHSSTSLSPYLSHTLTLSRSLNAQTDDER